MVLIFHPVQILQVCAHLFGGLGDLRHLYVDELFKVQQCIPHRVIQQRVAAVSLILWQDAHAVDSDGVRSFDLHQNVEQPERE